MASHKDPFMLNTNLRWDGRSNVVDQLMNKTFGVDGRAAGDYTAESTFADIIEINSDAAVYDANVTNPDSIKIGPGDTLASAQGKLIYIVGINQYTVKLTDGTVLTQAYFGSQLAVRILDSGTNYKVLFDFDDSWMAKLNGKAPVATISFPSNATQQHNFDSYIGPAYDDAYTPTCVAADTLIATPEGERRVKTLAPGDLVTTYDHGPQPVRWMCSRLMSRADLQANPKVCPIRIAAGALGTGIPRRDLIVSPQHRIMLQSRIAQRMFGTATVLTAAKNLFGLPGVEIVGDFAEILYVHLMFDRHEILLSDGAWSESLYLGKQARHGLTDEQIQEIGTIFPELLKEETLCV